MNNYCELKLSKQLYICKYKTLFWKMQTFLRKSCVLGDYYPKMHVNCLKIPSVATDYLCLK